MIRAQQQQILASIKSAYALAAVLIQKERGLNRRMQPEALLSKIKRKTRPAEKAENTEEIDRPLAGMMVDAGQEDSISKILMIC